MKKKTGRTNGVSESAKPVLLCFSHLRWNFVYQRPQHVMSLLANDYRVIFWEEPVWVEDEISTLSVEHYGQICVVTPQISRDQDQEDCDAILNRELSHFLVDHDYEVAIKWYYTPMMFAFSEKISANCIVYDCMDELTAFRFAPEGLAHSERELIRQAQVVFTGGASLFETKMNLHSNVHMFESSIDVGHFESARHRRPSSIEAPILGFYGVIDERMDMELISYLADARPDWTIELVGPIAKIDVADIPTRPNIRQLGARTYDALPRVISSWHVAMLPFLVNETTRFISPTKTPEYLAAGRPVVSTPIRDLITRYGMLEGVRIADTYAGFVTACEAAVQLATANSVEWLQPVDALLSSMSWRSTVSRMKSEIELAIK